MNPGVTVLSASCATHDNETLQVRRALELHWRDVGTGVTIRSCFLAINKTTMHLPKIAGGDPTRGPSDVVKHTRLKMSTLNANASAFIPSYSVEPCQAPAPPSAQQMLREIVEAQPTICKHFVAGECYRSECFYSHDLEGHVCSFWAAGGCLRGSDCWFAHPSDEQVLKMHKERFPAKHVDASSPQAVQKKDYSPPTAPPLAPETVLTLGQKLKLASLLKLFPKLPEYAVEQSFRRNGGVENATCKELEAFSQPMTRLQPAVLPPASGLAATSSLLPHQRSAKCDVSAIEWVETGETIHQTYRGTLVAELSVVVS